MEAERKRSNLLPLSRSLITYIQSTYSTVLGVPHTRTRRAHPHLTLLSRPLTTNKSLRRFLLTCALHEGPLDVVPDDKKDAEVRARESGEEDRVEVRVAPWRREGRLARVQGEHPDEGKHQKAHAPAARGSACTHPCPAERVRGEGDEEEERLRGNVRERLTVAPQKRKRRECGDDATREREKWRLLRREEQRGGQHWEEDGLLVYLVAEKEERERRVEECVYKSPRRWRAAKELGAHRCDPDERRAKRAERERGVVQPAPQLEHDVESAPHVGDLVLEEAAL